MYRTDFVEEKKNTFCFQICFFVNRTVYEEMWRNIAERDRTQTTIWRMCIACWITKATHPTKLRNNYVFFTEQIAARTRLIIALCIHSCLVKFPDVINIPVWILPDDGGGRKQRVGGNKELCLYLCCMCRCLFIKEKYDKAQLDEWLTQIY